MGVFWVCLVWRSLLNASIVRQTQVAHFCVDLRGENFWMAVDGVPTRLGFYTTRFVQAEGTAEAERVAVDLIRGDTGLASLNDRADPPMVFAEEIEEVGPSDVPSVCPGYGFFDDPNPPDA